MGDGEWWSLRPWVLIGLVVGLTVLCAIVLVTDGWPMSAVDTPAPVVSVETKLATKKPVENPTDKLSVVVFGYDLEENKCFFKPDEVRLAKLGKDAGVGGASMGRSFTYHTYFDENGKLFCRRTESEAPGKSWGLGWQDENTMRVNAGVEIDGKESKAEGRLTLKQGEVKILLLPDKTKPRYVYVFLVTPCARGNEPEKSP